jgi:hypothetical protein
VTTRAQIILCSLVYLGVVLFNYGFNGTDEYWVGMVKYLPAQSAPFSEIIKSDDVKLPSQILPLFYVAKAAYVLGIQDPFYQYRFVLAFFNLVLVLVCFFALKPFLNSKNSFLYLLAFHFAVPALVSRLMYESLSFPWMMLAVAYGINYDKSGSRKDLLLSLLGFCVAYALRAQIGICALGLVAVVLLNKKFQDFLLITLLGGGFFIALGFLDYFWSDRYYHTLRAAFAFNVQYGAEYSNAPWYFFFPLILIFLVFPWILFKWPQAVIEKLKQRRLAFYCLGFFLLLHMAFANKFERFLIPAFAMLIFMLEPFVTEYLFNLKTYRIRFLSLVLFNFSIWGLVTFQPSQKSVIDLVLYLSQHNDIRQVQNFSTEIEWFPDVLAKNAIAEIKNAEGVIATGQYALINQTQEQEFAIQNGHCTAQERFSVNAVDELAFKLNPAKNKRRAPLILYKCSGS